MMQPPYKPLEEGESKVVYKDKDNERVIRGRIVKEDEHFVYIERRNGQLRINKSVILRIEKWDTDFVESRGEWDDYDR